MPEYKFRDGARIPGQVRPADAEKALEAIASKHAGVLTPDDVLKAAASEKHPLHAAFTWDDTAAAKEFRLIEARQLIRAVVVVTPEETTPERRVWVHVAPGGYQTMEAVVSQEDAYVVALTSLEAKFGSAREALLELRQYAEQRGDTPERLAAIGLAVQGFDTVREALAILR